MSRPSPSAQAGAAIDQNASWPRLLLAYPRHTAILAWILITVVTLALAMWDAATPLSWPRIVIPASVAILAATSAGALTVLAIEQATIGAHALTRFLERDFA